jgi:Uri superfamily endonuclease
MRSSPGAYVLVVHLPAPTTVHAGGQGPIALDEGHFLYCGSAQAGLMPRLARHMRSDKKRHWHIDFLTCEGRAIGALAFEGGKETECQLAAALSRVPGIEPVGHGFGASDCKCPTHLFRVKDDVQLSLVLDLLRWSFSGGH